MMRGQSCMYEGASGKGTGPLGGYISSRMMKTRMDHTSNQTLALFPFLFLFLIRGQQGYLGRLHHSKAGCIGEDSLMFCGGGGREEEEDEEDQKIYIGTYLPRYMWSTTMMI